MNRSSGIALRRGWLATLFGTTAFATASNKELEARADEADARVGTLESRVNQSLIELQQQIEASRQELRTLRGQIEEARHDLETVRQQQRDLFARPSTAVCSPSKMARRPGPWRPAARLVLRMPCSPMNPPFTRMPSPP